ncbi:MAG: hypothetical protein ACJAWS_001292 [Oleiphilaceae bacterium]|jgi:hypothetical protein
MTVFSFNCIEQRTQGIKMSETLSNRAIIISAGIFLAVFLFYTLPAAIDLNDFFASFAAVFVNPLATSYSVDVIAYGFILMFWILFEAKHHGIRYGWLCIILCVVPAVAVAFTTYLRLRQKQFSARSNQT